MSMPISTKRPSRRKKIIPVIIVLILIAGAIGYALLQFHAHSTKPKTTATTAVEQPKPQTPAPSTPVTYPQPVKDPLSYQMIVNKKFQLASDFVPPDLVKPDVPNVNGQSVRKVTADALVQMFTAAKGDGLTLRLVSGYRSYSYQQGVYSQYVAQSGQKAADTYSARPGHSEHQSGLAADVDEATEGCQLDQCFGDTTAGKWVAAHAHEYGFIVRYQKDKEAITGYEYEPWHIRYVGVQAATAMFNSNKTMEEYYNVPGGDYAN